MKVAKDVDEKIKALEGARPMKVAKDVDEKIKAWRSDRKMASAADIGNISPRRKRAPTEADAPLVICQ